MILKSIDDAMKSAIKFNEKTFTIDFNDLISPFLFVNKSNEEYEVLIDFLIEHANEIEYFEVNYDMQHVEFTLWDEYIDLSPYESKETLSYYEGRTLNND